MPAAQITPEKSVMWFFRLLCSLAWLAVLKKSQLQRESTSCRRDNTATFSIRSLHSAMIKSAFCMIFNLTVVSMQPHALTDDFKDVHNAERPVTLVRT
jgi:hypothetical protein